MRNQDYTQELFADFFSNKVLYYAIAGGDVIICEDKELFRQLVKNYENKELEIKVGNLLEDGISAFSHNKELHDDLVHSVSMSQRLYAHGTACFGASEAYSSTKSAITKTFIATSSVENLKEAIAISIERYNTVAGKSFSRAEVSVVSGTMNIRTAINNKKVSDVVIYSDAESYSKEKQINDAIDAAIQEDEM